MSVEEAKRIVALAMESADDAPTYRQFLAGAEVAISAALATARTEARKAALEEAAKVVEQYAESAHSSARGPGDAILSAQHSAKLYACRDLVHAIRALIGTDPTADRGEG